MKRIIAVLLTLALLLACVPTPEKEFVVNKSDGVLQEKIGAAPVEATPEFPSHLTLKRPVQWGSNTSKNQSTRKGVLLVMRRFSPHGSAMK